MSDDNVADHFEFELTPEAIPLFKYAVMREAAKSVLRKFLRSKIESYLVSPSSIYVVDGEPLLHRAMRPQRVTCADVIEEYVEFGKIWNNSMCSI